MLKIKIKNNFLEKRQEKLRREKLCMSKKVKISIFLIIGCLLAISSFVTAAESKLNYIAPVKVDHVPYDVQITKGGALQLSLMGNTYIIKSEYSLVPGWAKLDHDKFTGFSNMEIEGDSFATENASFSLERKIVKHKECIEIVDIIKNKTPKDLPLIVRHKTKIPKRIKYYLGGLRAYMKRGRSSKPDNPTTICITPSGSLGFLALNDIFRVHVLNFAAKDIYGIADNSLVLRPGSSYTMRLAVFPSGKKDYYSQINAMRRFLNVNFEIQGSFCFFSMGKIKKETDWHRTFKPVVPIGRDMSTEKITKYLKNKDAYYTVLDYVPHYKGMFPHSYVWMTIADSKLYQETVKTIKQAFPKGNILIYFHSFIERLKDAKEKYKDSRVLNPNGSQADYRDPHRPLFFPTLDSSYGKDLEKLINFILYDCKADGIFWDEFPVSSSEYHYGTPWDNVTADIDPRTHEIKRKKSSVTLLSQPWREKQVKRILKEGKHLVANWAPRTETMLKYKFPRFTETGSVTKCVWTHLYTPIGLGDHLTEKGEKDAYRKMLELLNYGCLYYWYYYLIWPDYPTLTRYMFPITPIELHEGYILGKERIITAKSGYFSFGDNSNSEVHFFDKDGREVKRKATRVEKDGKIYYKVALGEFESCILVKQTVCSATVLGGNILCPLKSDPPPAIDSNLTEWFQNPGGFEIEKENISYGKSKWQGDADLSGTIWLYWDRNYLYLAADVTDDILKQDRSGREIWMGDHLELDIDLKSKPGAKGAFSQEEFSIGFSPGNFQNTGDDLFDTPPEVWIWTPHGVDSSKIDVAASQTEKGYTLEARIPWKILGITPKEGMILRMDVRISDTDTPGCQDTMSSLFIQKWEGRKKECMVEVKLGNTKGK